MTASGPRPTSVGPNWWQIAALASLGPMLLAIAALWLGGEYRHSGQTRMLVRQPYEQRRDIEQLFALVQQAETGHRDKVDAVLVKSMQSLPKLGSTVMRIVDGKSGLRNG